MCMRCSDSKCSVIQSVLTVLSSTAWAGCVCVLNDTHTHTLTHLAVMMKLNKPIIAISLKHIQHFRFIIFKNIINFLFFSASIAARGLVCARLTDSVKVFKPGK